MKGTWEIGFIPRKYSIRKINGRMVRVIEKFDLIEVSFNPKRKEK